MKKGILSVIASIIGHSAYCQSIPQIPPKAPKPAPPVSVPSSYSKTHCFINNTSTDATYFSTSYDKVKWDELIVPGLGTFDLPVRDSIFLRLYSSKTDYFAITAYRAKYYRIVYNQGSKKWIFEELK